MVAVLCSRPGRRLVVQAIVEAGAALALLVAVCCVVFMALDLGIQADDDTLEASQPLEQLCVGRLPALAGGAAGSWEYAFDLGPHTVGARVVLVALDFAPAAGDARPGGWSWGAAG